MDIISFNEAATANSRIEKFIENPDSAFGVVTVPSTIATGETITVPAGRTAILPDVTVEGELLVNGTVFIPTGTTYTQQTIKTEAISNVAGTTVVNVTDIAKSSIVTPALDLKANTADLKEIGVEQTWQDVTASRASGVTYTNSTYKPIQLLISVMNNSATNTTTFFWVNDVKIAKVQFVYNGDVIDAVSIIIPANSTYKVTASTALYIQTWFELR